MNPNGEGRKDDTGKPPWHLLPAPALEEIAKVLAFGARKYDAWNWAKGMAWSRPTAALFRHMAAFNHGEDLDPESGLPHLAHAGCCVLFLLTYQVLGLGTDDRYPLARTKQPTAETSPHSSAR